jgi:hypothetical protein
LERATVFAREICIRKVLGDFFAREIYAREIKEKLFAREIYARENKEASFARMFLRILCSSNLQKICFGDRDLRAG